MPQAVGAQHERTPSASPAHPTTSQSSILQPWERSFKQPLEAGLEAGFNPWPRVHASSPSPQQLLGPSLPTKLGHSERGLRTQPRRIVALSAPSPPLLAHPTQCPLFFFPTTLKRPFFFLFKSRLIVPGRMGRAAGRTMQVPFSQDVRWSSQGRKMLTVGLPQQAAFSSSLSFPLPSRLSR